MLLRRWIGRSKKDLVFSLQPSCSAFTTADPGKIVVVRGLMEAVCHLVCLLLILE